MGALDRLRSRRWFIEHLLTIEDQQGKRRPIGMPRPEQLAIVDAWNEFENVCIVKPRQMGASTITQALSFRDALLAPDPIRTLTLAHESGTVSRMNQMLRVFWQGLPKAIRPDLEVDNADTLQFAHNHAALMQYMAGGRGQGRSWTFQQFIATEQAFWPVGSASIKGGAEADRNAWTSVLATLHASPYRKVVVESTGDGPGGLFHDVARAANESQKARLARGGDRRPGDWRLLFFPWFDFPFYELDDPSYEPTVEDREYAEAFLGRFDPTTQARKLAWRAMKHGLGYTPTRFRREYPSTFDDPFLLATGTWFDGELANRLIGRIPPHHRKAAMHGEWREYLAFDPTHRYFVGFDSSGGTGRDWAVGVVLRDDYEVVAIWASNTASPHQQAEAASRLSATYGRALVLCEENNYGRAVNNEIEKLGAPTWRGPDGKRFWSQGGRAGESKLLVYTLARKLFNEQLAASAHPGTSARIHDEDLLQQIGWVKEGRTGNVEAPEGLHDDFVDAWALAIWCGRHYREREPDKRPTLKRLGW